MSASEQQPRLGEPAEPWFVVNATEQPWKAAPGYGRFTNFEPNRRLFKDYGINIAVIGPGDISTMYHGEDAQEDFVVLSGRCVAIIEGEERELNAWDFLHCPAWTRHGFANRGEEECVILMVGARRDGADVDCEYPVEPAAARYGASVAAYTTEPDVAYAGTPELIEEPYRQGTLPGA